VAAAPASKALVAAGLAVTSSPTLTDGYLNSIPFQFVIVHVFHGIFGVFSFQKFDKSEVLLQIDGTDLPEFRKYFFEFALVDFLTETSHINARITVPVADRVTRRSVEDSRLCDNCIGLCWAICALTIG